MTIKTETIDETIIELARTMRTLKALSAKRKSAFAGIRPTEKKEHAAALRASMDLTRKLADLRAGR